MTTKNIRRKNFKERESKKRFFFVIEHQKMTNSNFIVISIANFEVVILLTILNEEEFFRQIESFKTIEQIAKKKTIENNNNDEIS